MPYEDEAFQSGTPKMQKTRRRILELLKLRAAQTATELAQELNITPMGVRQHLTALERDGMVTYRTERRGVGRSSHVYLLTRAGNEYFPRAYDELANKLIAAVRSLEGDVGVRRVFNQLLERQTALYRAKLAGKHLGERVAELARIRTEEGYMCTSAQVDQGVYRLIENNCAIFQVAQQCSEACHIELELFRKSLTGTRVTRETHIMRGDRACIYLIEQTKSRGDGPVQRAPSGIASERGPTSSRVRASMSWTARALMSARSTASTRSRETACSTSTRRSASTVRPASQSAR